MKHTIYIHNYFPSVISTRKAISKLSDNLFLNAEDNYDFDLSEIDFISRSFADEFVKYIKNSGINWQLCNMNAGVKAMLEVVNRTAESKKRDLDYVAITSFRKKNDLNKFLATF